MEEIHFLFIMSYSVILQANIVDVCAGPDEAEAQGSGFEADQGSVSGKPDSPQILQHRTGLHTQEEHPSLSGCKLHSFFFLSPPPLLHDI